MAHSLSARKRARQNVKRKIQNQTVKTSIKTHLKKMRSMLAAKENKPSRETMAVEMCGSYKLLDKAVNKGVMHRNKAARLKSRLSLAANKSGQK